MNALTLGIMVALAWAAFAGQSQSNSGQSRGPGRRYGVALAADATTRHVILFGGSNPRLTPVARYADTWAWDGSQWTNLSQEGPSARANAAMVFDAKGRRALLFGGFDGQRLLQDTWQWQDHRWTQITPRHSPDARGHFAMAFHESKQQIVLFGGAADRAGGRIAYDDTWIWNGTDWTKAPVAGPSARFAHAMAYDPIGRRIILSGGRDNDDRPLSDTWAWNGTEWRELSTSGPPPRLLHALAFDENLGVVILFGGWDATPSSSLTAYLSDTWELKGSQWKLLPVSGPPGIRGHTMFNDVRRRRIVLFGGETRDAILGQTWEWNGTSWLLRADVREGDLAPNADRFAFGSMKPQ